MKERGLEKKSQSANNLNSANNSETEVQLEELLVHLSQTESG